MVAAGGAGGQTMFTPKPDGGNRKLGIPTVLDRIVQQAAMQVLQRLFDPTFSEHNYGFRPRPWPIRR